MKRNNKKLATFILAGALSCSAFLGTAFLNGSVAASADEAKAKTYALSGLFTTSSSSIDAEKLGDETAMTTKFVFDQGANSSKITYKRNVAFKWFAGKDDARYMSTTFALGKVKDFKGLNITLNSDSSLTEEKAANSIKFEMDETGVSVYVVADGDSEEEITKSKESAVRLALADGDEITVSFTEEKPANADATFEYAYDEYGVKVKAGEVEEVVGTFKHLGSSYVNNGLVFEAISVEEGEAPVVYFDSLNEQAFNNIVSEGEGDTAKLMVVDNAAPVIVANEKINGFMLGAKYSFDYKVVDVLQTSSLSDTNEYYQFNPADSEVKYATVSTTYFMDEVYYVDAQGNITSEKETNGVKNTACSVFRDYEVNGVKGGNEYVSVQIKVGDDTFKNAEGDFAKAVYDLAWYAEDGATQLLKVGDKEVEFVKVNTSQTGAIYSYIGVDNENKVNVITEENAALLESHVAAYNEALKKAAEKVYAGSNAKLELPSLSWLFEDDNGYNNLKFTICYKTVSSSSLNKTNLAYNNLTIPTTSIGCYEFKVFATDKAGNTMQYYLDGELVSVTTSNIWDIEEIPYFTFNVINQGLRVEETSSADSDDRTSKQNLDKTYTLSSFTDVGGESQKSDYALYKVDMSKYNKTVGENSEKRLTRKILASVTFEKIRTGMLDKLYLVNDKTSEYHNDYFALYLDTYLGLIAKELGVEVSALKPYFVEIAAYDAENEEAADNKYEWKKSGSSSFKTVEEGEYLMLADYCDTLLPTTSRAVAYKLVVVDSKVDTIEGESKFWRFVDDNLVSIILFGVAGVMLILIIILLLIKPSDEKLEDVDKKAAKKEKENE